LYTDGITETENGDGEFFGKERLKGVLAREHKRPAAGIIEAILDALRAFTGSATFNDDISMLALKFLP
jgi:Serine phosphatase RsbU, regulator of sigma subunit